MSINYQDRNLIVTYIQVLMKEKFGETIHKVIPRKKSESSYYEVTKIDPLLVTGRYNEQTYSAVALYMAKNYPNEGFPYIYYVDEDGNLNYRNYYYQGVIVENIAGDGDSSHKQSFKLINTQGVSPSSLISVIYYFSSSEGIYLKEVKTEKEWDSQSYVYQFTDSSRTIFKVKLKEENDPVGTKEHIEVQYDNLVDVISNNMEMSRRNKDIITLSDRILSYLLGEVVSEISSPEEIIRAKSLISGKVDFNLKLLSYDIGNLICGIQRDFIKRYSRSSEDYYLKLSDELKLNTKFLISSNINNIEISSEVGKLSPNSYRYDYVTGLLEFYYTSSHDTLIVRGSKFSDINLPDYYSEIKVTGYVDPITELILKQGVESEDE